MGIAIHLQEYLNQKDINYDVVSHDYTENSLTTARTAHISGDCVAKSVLLEDDFGFVMAVLPATHRLSLADIKAFTHRNLMLAAEDELGEIFNDCELGAIPAVGDAYGMEMLVDDSIAEKSDVYFEAGDHQNLIHVDSEEFADLTENAERLTFSHHI